MYMCNYVRARIIKDVRVQRDRSGKLPYSKGRHDNVNYEQGTRNKQQGAGGGEGRKADVVCFIRRARLAYAEPERTETS